MLQVGWRARVCWRGGGCRVWDHKEGRGACGARRGVLGQERRRACACPLWLQSANVGDSSAVLIQLQLPAPGEPPPAQAQQLGSSSNGKEHAAAAAAAATASPSHQQERRRQGEVRRAPAFAPPPGAEGGWLLADGTSTSSSGNGSGAASNGNGAAEGGAPSTTSLPWDASSPQQHHAASSSTPVVGHWLKLSEDHRISSSAKERERLAQLGHRTVRTRLYGLNIARMLGDRFLKDEALGFTAEPHVSARVRATPGDAACAVWRHPRDLDAEGEGQQGPGAAAAAEAGAEAAGGVVRKTLLLVASDGLWDVLAEGKAAAFVARTLMQDPGEQGSRGWRAARRCCGQAAEGDACGAGARAGTSVAELAGLLVGQAVTLRSKDDITVLVAELH